MKQPGLNKSMVDCVSFSSSKKPSNNLASELKSFITRSVSFNGDFLKKPFSKTEQLIQQDLNNLETITPQTVNQLFKSHLVHPERFIVKDISELPHERKSLRTVIAHKTMHLPETSVHLFIDQKGEKEDLKTSILYEVRSYLEDLEIKKTTSAFREKLTRLPKPVKAEIEKILLELNLSNNVKIVDSSIEKVLEYYKQFPAICVPDVSNPDNPVSTLYINFSMSRIDIEQSTVHEFVHILQALKDKNFFIDNENTSKKLRQQINTAAARFDTLLQNVLNSEIAYFSIINESELAPTTRKFDLFKAAIAREMQESQITDFNNFIEKIHTWALHEAEAYKEGIITAKENPDFIRIAQSNSGISKEKLIGSKDNPTHLGIELLPRYYQEFANSIHSAID